MSSRDLVADVDRCYQPTKPNTLATVNCSMSVFYIASHYFFSSLAGSMSCSPKSRKVWVAESGS